MDTLPRELTGPVACFLTWRVSISCPGSWTSGETGHVSVFPPPRSSLAGGRGGGGFQQHGLSKRLSDPVDAAPAPALSSLTSFDNFLLICRNANVFSEPQGPAGSGSAPVTLWTLATRPSLLLASAPGPLHIPGGDFSFLPHPVTSVHPLDLSSNRPR